MKTTLVSPHINQPCPPKLRKGGLHDIERASFVSSTSGALISSLDKRTRQAQQDELLRLASSNVRICNASKQGTYDGRELHQNPGIPAERFAAFALRFAAFALPSRVGGRLFYPGGRVVVVG